MIPQVPHGWFVHQANDGTIHVVPELDICDHFPHDCPCHPEQDDECENLYKHNSFDGREDFETGKRKMS